MHIQAEEYWWEGTEKNVHDRVWSTVEALDAHQAYRRQANLHNVRMYSSRMARSLYGGDYAISDHGARIKINGIKSVIDTAAAQISSNRAMPDYLTEGGRFEQRQQAQMLKQWVAGQFQQLKIDQKSVKSFLDACIVHTGAIKVVATPDDRIIAERTFPDELLVDDIEARNLEECKTLFQVKEVSKERLLRHPEWGKSPKKRKAIEGAGTLTQRLSNRRSVSDGRCHIVEAWRQPSYRGAGDGKHCIVLDSGPLEINDWTRGFPFAFFRFTTPPLGFWGIALTEELASMQMEINYIAQKVQVLMNLSTTKVAMRHGESDDAFTNEDLGTIWYKNTPPQVLNVQPVHQQMIDYMWSIYYKMYEQIGISQAAATSEAPVGLKSGEAIRRNTDLGARRFQHVGQDWERFRVDIGDRIIEAAEEIEDRGRTSVETLAIDGDSVSAIKFKQARLDRERYVTRVFPTSLLPDTPQGKVDTIAELAGAFPELGGQALGMLTGVPDLKSAVSRLNAAQDLIDSQIASMLGGDPKVPHPYQDLKLAIDQASLAAQEADENGTDEATVELLRNYVDMAVNMLQSQQMAQPGPPGPSGPPPSQPPGPPAMPAPPAGAPPEPGIPG